MDNQLVNQKNEENKDLRKLSFLSLMIILLLALLYSGCKETCDKQLITYTEPVYAPMEDIRVEATYEAPRAIKSPGKIYYKDEFIFINEIDSGIHVIDNTDKNNPTTIGFVRVVGNKDLAARGDFMYVDSYMDLVVLNISDKHNISEINRVNDVFDAYYYHDDFFGTVIDWVEVEEVVEVDCDEQMFFIDRGWGGAEGDFALSQISNGSTTGIGGSLARFTITDNYLYTINEYAMKLFDISTLDNPVQGNTIDLGWGIETIFPYQDKLFIGARTGMHIYDNTTPENPSYVSTYAHVNTCDPVVVQDNYAYVTLRSGTECETFTNQLDVIDISDVTNPTLVKTYPMDNPHGLGVNGSCLFIAEGDYGLKVFNISDVNTISDNMLAHHKDVHALDVIPLNDVLFMIGNDGLYQYNYNCGTQFQYLSDISF